MVKERNSQGTEGSRNGTVKEWNRMVEHKELFDPITNGTVLKGTVIKRFEPSTDGFPCKGTVIKQVFFFEETVIEWDFYKVTVIEWFDLSFNRF